MGKAEDKLEAKLKATLKREAIDKVPLGVVTPQKLEDILSRAKDDGDN